MENRERDRVSQRTSPTDAGQINRETAEQAGREQNSGTTAEFGQSIGRSEDLEGGEMRNRDDSNMENMNRENNSENETSRRERSGGFGTSTGRSGSVGNRGGGGSDISRDEMNENESKRPSGIGDPSEGRH